MSPDRALMWVSWIVIALASLQILLFAFGRDQGIYAVVGEGLLEGKVPYRDVWDFKPPGIFLVYATAEALFGHSMASIRVLEILSLLVMAWAFHRLAREFFGAGVVGVVAAALAALVQAQLEFWHTGQPETFGGVLTVLALLSVARASSASLPAAHPQRLVVVSGLLFGCAFLLKPPLGGGAIVCAAYLARVPSTPGRPAWPPWKAFLVVGASSLVPIALCAGWFWARGGWEALAWTLFEFVPGYTALNTDVSALSALYYVFEEAFVGFSALLAMGAGAAVLLRPIAGREQEGIFLVLGVVCMQLAGVAMQAKFFQYHYAATLPLIAFIAGLGFYKLFRRAVAAGAGGVVLFALALWALAAMRSAVRTNPGTFWERSAARMAFLSNRDREALDAKLYYVADYDFDADRAVADYVARVVPEDRSVFVWGFEPVIYWLSDRRPASRYVYNVAQRVSWDRDRARDELMEDLAEDPPAAIVVEHEDVFAHVTGNRLDSADALEGFPEFSRLIDAEYRLDRAVGKFDVYRRQ